MSTAVRRAIYGRLAGDTTLTGLLASPPAGYAKSIYYQQAPERAKYPLVVFQKTSGIPTGSFTAANALQNDIWQVKAIDDNTSADAAEAVAARLDALLNDAPLSISGVNLLYLRRESDIDYPEQADGETYHHTGGLYRLITG